MTKYVLDTNIYIAAIRERSETDALDAFYDAHLASTFLHAVVARELAAGAIGDTGRRLLERTILEPFERRDRLIVPSYAAWKRSGELVAKLVRKGHFTAGGVPRSFANDALLAASCREAGAVLVTRNTADFEVLASVETFRFSAPFPAEA